MLTQPKVPSAPDPNTIAGAQTSANLTSGLAGALLNRPDVYSPYGRTTNQATGSVDLGNGYSIPTFAQTTQLNPQLQQIQGTNWDTQQGIAQNLGNTASTLGQNLGYASTPLDFSSLPGFGGVPGLPGQSQRLDPQTFNQNAVDAVYNQATSRLNPQWEQAGEQQDQRLADQGIQLGSEAYDRAQGNFDRAKNDAYTSAQNTATTTGANVANQLFGENLNQNQQLFGQGLQANQQGYNEILGQRQQGLQEQQLARSFPLQQLLSVAGGLPGVPQPQNPNYPTSPVYPPNISGAYQVGQQGQQNAYADASQPYSQTLGALGSLGSSVLQSGLTSTGSGASSTPGWLVQAAKSLWSS